VNDRRPHGGEVIAPGRLLFRLVALLFLQLVVLQHFRFYDKHDFLGNVGGKVGDSFKVIVDFLRCENRE
jgi:hypothetical protein